MGWKKNTPDDVSQFSYLGIIDKRYWLFVTVSGFYAPFVIMTVLFVRMYCLVKDQVRQIQAMEIVDKKAQNSYYERETRSVRGLLILSVAFLLSWLPLCILYNVIYFCSSSCHILPIIVIITSTCTHVYAAIHPILSIYALQDFRKRAVHCWTTMSEKIYPENCRDLNESTV
ncbi:adenosine receptor A1-like [Glandiceps talaboti]